MIALLGFVALVLGLFISQQVHLNQGMDVTQFHGTFLEKPRPVHSFSLTGIDNVPFRNESLKGHWTMVFFGFTNCGSICPTTMAELGKMVQLLEERGVNTRPEVVMISVDPKRDSMDKLKHYVKAFNPRFYGARGDEEAIMRMAQEMGIAYATIPTPMHENKEHYDIEHTGTVILFNPNGELSAFFTTPHQAAMLAEDYQKLVS